MSERKIRLVSMPEPDVYTPEQEEAIRDAILAAQDAIPEYGDDGASRFFKAFVAAGGIHHPGRKLHGSERSLIISAVTQAFVTRRGIPHSITGADGGHTVKLSDEIWATALREHSRAQQEAYRHSISQSPSCAGIRLVLSPNAPPSDEATAWATEDNYGLGPGVFPIDEVIVLPPSCDLAMFTVVFADEVPGAVTFHSSPKVTTPIPNQPFWKTPFGFGIIIAILGLLASFGS